MAFKWPPKDPNEVLDYEHDWGPRLDGDVIVGQPEVIVETGDVVADDPPTSLVGSVQKVWLSAGTIKESGEPEKLTLRVNTQAGRVLDEGINVTIKER